jgi:hypothetical protein
MGDSGILARLTDQSHETPDRGAQNGHSALSGAAQCDELRCIDVVRNLR